MKKDPRKTPPFPKFSLKNRLTHPTISLNPLNCKDETLPSSSLIPHWRKHKSSPSQIKFVHRFPIRSRNQNPVRRWTSSSFSNKKDRYFLQVSEVNYKVRFWCLFFGVCGFCLVFVGLWCDFSSDSRIMSFMGFVVSLILFLELRVLWVLLGMLGFIFYSRIVSLILIPEFTFYYSDSRIDDNLFS